MKVVDVDNEVTATLFTNEELDTAAVIIVHVQPTSEWMHVNVDQLQRWLRNNLSQTHYRKVLLVASRQELQFDLLPPDKVDDMIEEMQKHSTSTWVKLENNEEDEEPAAPEPAPKTVKKQGGRRRRR